MTVRFNVPGTPVSINRQYQQSKSGKRFLGKDAVVFKERIRAYAIHALRSQNLSWPSLKTIKRRSIELTITTYGSRADVDAPAKFGQDALEGIFYTKDSAVKTLVLDTEPSNTPYMAFCVRLL